MNGPDDSLEARAARRRGTWRERFGADAQVVQASESTITDRLALMRSVAETAWAFAGRELPDYTRDHMPGRMIRPA